MFFPYRVNVLDKNPIPERMTSGEGYYQSRFNPSCRYYLRYYDGPKIPTTTLVSVIDGKGLYLLLKKV
jgi:hypothetical protein